MNATNKIKDSLADLVHMDKPDTKKEEDEISQAKLEIEKMKAIIQEKNEMIALKKRLDLQKQQESNLMVARKTMEQLGDQIEIFKRTKPFNDNLSFISQLVTYYNHLDNYQKSTVYKTTDPELYNEERDYIRKVKKWGDYALDKLGDRQYRSLLLSFSQRFETIEKGIRSIKKSLKK